MSFGIGGGIASILQLCFVTYRRCRDGPTEIQETAHQVQGLGIVLRRLERTAASAESTLAQPDVQNELQTLIRNCRRPLQRLFRIVLQRQKLTIWDRIRVDADELQRIRSSLHLHQTNIDMFLRALPTRTIERIAGVPVRIDVIHAQLESLIEAVFSQTSNQVYGQSDARIPIQAAAEGLRSSVVQNIEYSQSEDDDFQRAQELYSDSQLLHAAAAESLQDARQSSTGISLNNSVEDRPVDEVDDRAWTMYQFESTQLEEVRENEEHQRMHQEINALEDASSHIHELELKIDRVQGEKRQLEEDLRGMESIYGVTRRRLERELVEARGTTAEFQAALEHANPSSTAAADTRVENLLVQSRVPDMVNGGWRCYRLPSSSRSDRDQLVFIDVLCSLDRRRVFRRPPILEGSEHQKVLPLPESWKRIESNAGRVFYRHSPSGYCMYQHPKKSSRVDYRTGQPRIPSEADLGPYRSVLFGKWILDDINAACQLSRTLFREVRSTSTAEHEPRSASAAKEPSKFTGLQPWTGSDAVSLECDVGELQNRFIEHRWRGSWLYKSVHEPVCLIPHELGKTCTNCTSKLESHPSNCYFREWSSAPVQSEAASSAPTI